MNESKADRIAAAAYSIQTRGLAREWLVKNRDKLTCHDEPHVRLRVQPSDQLCTAGWEMACALLQECIPTFTRDNIDKAIARCDLKIEEFKVIIRNEVQEI